MGYRKGYYKKDGTYVQGHYTSTKSKKNNKNSKSGCYILLLFMVVFIDIANILIELI
tara:strand:+ start:4515 stop:4685 length:171 start_codon:yes stop_codon:yes gene_type:complete